MPFCFQAVLAMPLFFRSGRGGGDLAEPRRAAEGGAVAPGLRGCLGHALGEPQPGRVMPVRRNECDPSRVWRTRWRSVDADFRMFHRSLLDEIRWNQVNQVSSKEVGRRWRLDHWCGCEMKLYIRWRCLPRPLAR